VARRHLLLVALEPVAEALGAILVAAPRVQAGDIPLCWEGEVVGGLRLPGVQGTLDRMMLAVEQELGAPLVGLSREDKQAAVQMLHDRGAFELRRSVETVAEAMGVSRFTIYNYLNAADLG
jgi:HTH domain